MKKKLYIIPQTEVVELKADFQLLAGSLPKGDGTTSEQWSRGFDDYAE
ncbi:MAG: hypothetical protein J6V87_01145 [Prevotella sp.]|jgi:hypothetical protein|nr:hypothetical protein [Prevotella sp.]